MLPLRLAAIFFSISLYSLSLSALSERYTPSIALMKPIATPPPIMLIAIVLGSTPGE
ncbi:hypothetical protein D3C81_2059860 [compost metagenome]